MVEILAHVLVPRHEILSKEEKQKVLEKLGVKDAALPKIFETDPVIKRLRGNPGDVVKITRESPTAGKTIYYRLVVED